MIEGKQITKSSGAPPAAASLKLADIYYVLFRRKWLILCFFAAGLIAAAVVYFGQPSLYFSEAKLLIRYVIDSRSIDSGTGATRSPDNKGEAIISTEIEILTSFDLCKEVAEQVGPERVLGKGGSNVISAAAMIRGGVIAESPRRSNIIKVRFAHPDPSVCQVVLSQLIELYFKRHLDIHGLSKNYDDILTQQAQTLLVRIRENEKNLHDLQVQAGVISVEDAKKTLGEEVTRLRSEIFSSEALLAEYNLFHGPAPRPIVSTTNSEPPASPEKIAEYKFISSRAGVLIQRELELSAEFPEENPQVKRIREQIANNENRKKALETEFPRLVGYYVAPSPASPDADPRPALESKLRLLTNELAHVRSELASLDGFASSIADIERKLRLDERNYQHIAAGLEAARFDEVLASAKMSNIQAVQTPSAAAPDVSQRMKYAGMGLGGFLFAGLALAFVLELLIDTTVRRPGDFETKIQIPLFLSIPKLALNGHAKMLPFPTRLLPAPPADEAGGAVALHQTWDSDHALRPYVDGLRDRVLIHFEGDPHKPKLIGLTSSSKHVGVSSLAAGLAGALSETGDGNVLLLNLNFESQSVHPFYRGELTCDLTDVLESDKRQSGMVLQNLYVATAGHSSDPVSENLSKQLARVVPRLRVSDYDYIVFDLPPTTPTTMTARLAGMMDLVVLVVESGKDTQDAVKQAAKLLSRSKAPVSAVLNKVKNPVPLWLHKEV